MLLDAGPIGVHQTLLLREVDHFVLVDDMVQFLESLRAEDAVQKFNAGFGKIIWRATDLLPSFV